MREEQRYRMTKKIIKKWNHNCFFVRFLDGDKTNHKASNLKKISIMEAMDHFDDWVTDWDYELSDKEKKMVSDPEWRKGMYEIEPAEEPKKECSE